VARRRLVHRPWFVATASTLAATYLRAVDALGRWDEAFDPETVAVFASGRPVIAAFWHQRTLGVPRAWHRLQRCAGVRRSATAIVSEHGDGELIARTLGRMGIGQIRGSTRRGGARAARQARDAVARGHSLAVVVDGPRGPHAHVHGGATFLAKATGCPLVPTTFAVAHGLQARSWDRMLVPLPFTRGRYHVGAPLYVAPDADRTALEAARAELARRLDALSAEADAVFGVPR
jgi:lysophospholipid acyltransferase (LPLAT)-like uncharacterized protein